MLGRRGPQRGLFEADALYGEFVGRDTFYGWLAAQRDELFRDEDFAGLYVAGIGRPSGLDGAQKAVLEDVLSQLGIINALADVAEEALP
jgi:hypothetical protein